GPVDWLSTQSFDSTVSLPFKKQDNLLHTLCQYYDEVKTKRQLNLNVPAGFRNNSSLQRQVLDFRLQNTSPPDLSLPDITSSTTESQEELSLQQASNIMDEIGKDSLTNSSSSVKVPILRCVDKPSTSLPNHITCTE
ncbi:MAG: hypothetical protein ACK53Y_11040, partial [bacterium]